MVLISDRVKGEWLWWCCIVVVMLCVVMTDCGECGARGPTE